MQASLRVRFAGLGWKQASKTARPTNLAALIATRPLVTAMIQDAANTSLFSADVLLDDLDQKLASSSADFLQSLAEVDRVRAEEFLQQARTVADDSRARAWGERDGPWRLIPRRHQDGATYVDSPLTESEGGPAGRRGRTTSSHLHPELAALSDRSRLRQLEADLESQGNWPQLDGLRELRHRDISHKWISHLDTKNGAVLAAADFVLNVQKRLGARSHACGLSCQLCGEQLDPQVEHLETCSTAEATRGHYACVQTLVNGLRLADPTVTTEPRCLTSLTSRPADVLTVAAVPGRSAALDVCVLLRQTLLQPWEMLLSQLSGESSEGIAPRFKSSIVLALPSGP